MILHTLEDAVAIARRLRATPDADLTRVATGLSLKAVLSLAVLAHQLDDLAQAAAAHLTQPRDHDAWAALQERLIAWGYLPLPHSPTPPHPRRPPMAKAKTKGVATNLPVPQSDAEAEQQIARLGALQRDLATAQAHHDASVAALETAHATVLKASQEDQKAIVEGLAIWASAHRERLTGGGRTKTVQLVSGTILWREGRYAVKHRPLKVEEVVAEIQNRCSVVSEGIAAARAERKRGEVEALTATLGTLSGFLRTKIELSKEAMLAAREIAETIPGVTVPRGAEEFAVEPLASQISEVA